jgi:hypothetical protein
MGGCHRKDLGEISGVGGGEGGWCGVDSIGS